MSAYTVKNLENKLSYIITLNRQSFTLHIPQQKLYCLPCAVSTAWTAFMRRRQLVSTYSMNTKRSLSAVFTTRRNLLAIKAYSHCTVSLCSMTPFIPSTYSITCPSAVNKTVLALLCRDQAVGKQQQVVQVQYQNMERHKCREFQAIRYSRSEVLKFLPSPCTHTLLRVILLFSRRKPDASI